MKFWMSREHGEFQWRQSHQDQEDSVILLQRLLRVSSGRLYSSQGQQCIHQDSVFIMNKKKDEITLVFGLFSAYLTWNCKKFVKIKANETSFLKKSGDTINL